MGIDQEVIPGVAKIAVLRPNSLGDFIFSEPALRAVRNAYPRAEIVYLGLEWHVAYLPNRFPAVDRVEVVPVSEGVFWEPGMEINPEEQEEFFRRMQAEEFDLAIQLFGGGRFSNPFTRRLGACFAVGAKDEDAIPLDRWTPYQYYQHEVLRNLEVVSLVGARTEFIEPQVPVLEGDLAEAEPVIERLTKPFVVIHPGASSVRRRWPAAYFAQVADAIVQKLDMQVVLTGVAWEEETVRQVEQEMEQEAVNLCGQLTLPGFTAFLSQAGLVITNNTGPLHLALAVGTPAIGLFFAEHVITTLPLFRRNFQPLISWNRHCPDCGKYCDKAELDNRAAYPCQHLVSFLEEIQPEQVFQEARRFLEAQVLLP